MDGAARSRECWRGLKRVRSLDIGPDQPDPYDARPATGPDEAFAVVPGIEQERLQSIVTSAFEQPDVDAGAWRGAFPDTVAVFAAAELQSRKAEGEVLLERLYPYELN